jgi:uncharacterized UBP type Zn finger protein
LNQSPKEAPNSIVIGVQRPNYNNDNKIPKTEKKVENNNYLSLVEEATKRVKTRKAVLDEQTSIQGVSKVE